RLFRPPRGGPPAGRRVQGRAAPPGRVPARPAPDARAEVRRPRCRRHGPPLGPAVHLSLLGLVRHMSEVERPWCRRRLAGLDAPPRYGAGDADFDGAVGDPEVVAEAWS